MTAQDLGPAPVATGNGEARKSDLLRSRIDSKNTKFGITTQPLDWRAHLSIHPAADKFPPLSGKELKELAGDIKRNGLKVGITFWRPDDKTTPVLLDGRNRMDALAMLGQLALNGAGELCFKWSDGSLLEVTSYARFPIITGGGTGKDGKARQQPARKRKKWADAVMADVHALMQPAKKTAKPKSSASQDRRELEAKQAYIDDLEAARERDQGLDEQLQAAKIKIIGLETEIEELKAENTKLREQLDAAQKVA